MTDTAQPDVQSWHFPRLVAAWLSAVIVSLVVVFFAPHELRMEWLTLAVGVCTLISFGLQLGTAQKQGFITRLSFSVVGSVIIIVATGLVALLVDMLR